MSDDMVGSVLDSARDYIMNVSNRERLVRDPAAVAAQQDWCTMEQNYNELFDKPEVIKWVETELKEAEKYVTACKEKKTTVGNPENHQRLITYFAGPLGSYNKLAMSDWRELKAARNRSVILSFADFKESFKRSTGIDCKDYYKIRPLMHAINLAYRSIAENTMPMWCWTIRWCRWMMR